MNDQTFRILPTGDPNEGLQPSFMVEKKWFLGDDKTESNFNYFESNDGKIFAGVWECTPYEKEHQSYPTNEICMVISGSVTLTNEAGQSDTFTAGDTFFIEKGAHCTWKVTETLRKYFMSSD